MGVQSSCADTYASGDRSVLACSPSSSTSPKRTCARWTSSPILTRSSRIPSHICGTVCREHDTVCHEEHELWLSIPQERLSGRGEACRHSRMFRTRGEELAVRDVVQLLGREGNTKDAAYREVDSAMTSRTLFSWANATTHEDHFVLLYSEPLDPYFIHTPQS